MSKKRERSFAQLNRYENQFELLQKKQESEEEKEQEQKVEEKREESQADLKPEDPKPEEKEKDHQPEPETVDDPEELEEREEDYEENYLSQFKRKKPAKVKETFDIDKNLHQELKALSKRYGYGFKSKFINTAIKRELERIKKLEKEK